MSRPRAIRRSLACALTAAAAFALAPSAQAQEFAPGSCGPDARAAVLLDRALGGVPGAALESHVTRWFALPELETRALAAGVRVRSLSLAAGVASVGEPDFGWNAAAVALASGADAAGVAVRALARRERAAGALAWEGLASGASFEAGAGAWLSPVSGMLVWGSAPQLWTRGEAPPLARPLQIGLRAAGPPLRGWVALDAPRGGLDGARTLGLELARGGLALWSEAHDQPWRASLGLRARWHRACFVASVDAHPELPETTHFGVSLGAAGDPDAGRVP